MSANGSPVMNHDNAMEVEDENQSLPRPSPMMRSRFDHMSSGLHNGGRVQSGQRNSGDFTITAGMGSHSPVLPRRGQPVFTGASVTTVVHGGSEPAETISTSILRPHSGGSDDARIRPNYQSQPVGSDRDIVGVVRIGEVREDAEQTATGQPGQQQEQQNQHQRPLPNSHHCSPQIPITPDPPRPQQIQIYVKNIDGKTYTFKVEKSTLVEDLMRMIQERIGMPPDQQVLQFAGKNLQRGNTLEYYDIEEGSTIHLTKRNYQHQQHQRPLPNFHHCGPQIPITPEPPRPQQIQIHVKNIDGKTYTFTVEKSTLVEDLMRKIKERIGIPPDQQVLQFAGRNLQTGYILGHYNIEEGSTIFLTGRLRGG